MAHDHKVAGVVKGFFFFFGLFLFLFGGFGLKFDGPFAGLAGDFGGGPIAGGTYLVIEVGKLRPFFGWELFEAVDKFFKVFQSGFDGGGFGFVGLVVVIFVGSGHGFPYRH